MIIGLSGKRGVGKTTLAQYLFRHHGFIRVGFSEQLKKLAMELFPELTVADLTDYKKKEKKFKDYDWSPRELLIHLGEFMRFHDEDYWLDKGLELCKDPKKNYVFDDVRFPNEHSAIRNAGGRIIRLERFVKLNVYGEPIDIPSETALDKAEFDYKIHDCENVTLKDLYVAGDRAVKELLGAK